MEFICCDRVEETDVSLRYRVTFAEGEMKTPLGLAYRFLYRDAKIDAVNNDNPYEHLVEMVGKESISGYVDGFLRNYVANSVALREDFFPYGTPRVDAILEGLPDGVGGFLIEYRKTPRYELSEYGPLQVIVPSGGIDEEEKARRLVDALKARFQSEIKGDDLMPVLEEMTRRFFRKLEMDGVTLEKYCKKHDINDERLHMILFNEAVDEFKENMALDAIYRHEGLHCEEIDERVVLLQIDPDRPDALRRQLGETCSIGMLRQAAQRQAARRWAMENVEYLESGSPDAFDRMPGEETLDAIRRAVAKMSEEATER